MSDAKKNHELTGQGDSSNDVSRRKFLAGSASVVAAGTAIGMMGAASHADAAVAPKPPESPDTSVR